jgi:hypothetical protein
MPKHESTLGAHLLGTCRMGNEARRAEVSRERHCRRGSHGRQGRVVLYGPEILKRAQPHATFKFLFNAIHAAGPH